MTKAQTVNTFVRNHTGVVELDRPKALNSLNPEMIDAILSALEEWRDNDEVEQVLVVSTNEKAFCAGGDVRAARDGVLDGKLDEVDAFFENEYTLNATIADYPKPYIAILDGVVMGGGLGISVHGSHRVVTDKTFASMPEMAIGYITDVGVAYAAQRAIGTRNASSPALAKFWGITGYRQYAADLLWTGIATHYVEDAEAFAKSVIDEGLESALSTHATLPEDTKRRCRRTSTPLRMPSRQRPGKRFPSVWKKHDELREEVGKLLDGACPTSIVAAAELFRAEEGAGSVREALDYELALGKYMLRRDDFAEGIRAVLVDKTRDASFNPSEISDVDIDAIREALGS
ncbi:Enoyl-CoA hydratase/carnithine racemase [Corynebacterium camporealensis]|uniref:3-hydroxyisobutyryl-CoA hydrolase n=1 Tax=Corynebacterium camporealensis TaxID=161896 RepID=UPI000D1FE010|nr:3-hydroxyisobutyryl-CoA hydrolase [Corynebacterium camporealensis]AVH88044.1 Enoyl-CoA hydratase/carnithine racemase [Corynebacterium camporealensis]